MEAEEIDYEEVQNSLLNQYMENGKESVLRKILNLNPEKKKLKPLTNTPKYHMKSFRPKLYSIQKPPNAHLTPKDPRIDTDIRKFDFYYDPMYKEKQMKGSSKWATQRLNVMKINIAKRYSAPVDSIQFPRKEYSIGNKQVLSGNVLTEGNINHADDNQNAFHFKPIKRVIRKVETKYKADKASLGAIPVISKKSCKF